MYNVLTGKNLSWSHNTGKRWLSWDRRYIFNVLIRPRGERCKQALTSILQISNFAHFCQCRKPYAHFVKKNHWKLPHILYYFSLSGEQLPLFSRSPPTAAAPCYQGEQRNYTAPIKSVHQAAMGTAPRFFRHFTWLSRWQGEQHCLFTKHRICWLIYWLTDCIGWARTGTIHFHPRNALPHSLAESPEAGGREVVESTRKLQFT